MNTGRFLRLKRNVVMNKNEKIKMHQFMEYFRCNTLTSMNITNAKEKIVRKGCGNLFKSISFSFISKYLSSSVTVIILYFLTIIGITKNKKNSKKNIPLSLLISSTIAKAMEKERAKIIFQKLIFVLNLSGILFITLCFKLFSFVKYNIIHLLYALTIVPVTNLLVRNVDSITSCLRITIAYYCLVI